MPADPHIVPEMDFLDRMTVILYRTGLCLAGPATLCLLWDEKRLLFLATVLCASSLHLYYKAFRLLLLMAAWTGLLLAACGLPMLGIAACFITLGGLCFKENFCFKIPAIRYQPLVLAALWFGLVFEITLAAYGLAAMAAILFLMTGLSKCRMPLHYDIGDRSKYQI